VRGKFVTMRRIYLLFLVWLFAVTNTVGAAEEEEYVVGPRDSLDITVWNEPNLTKVFPVSKKGILDLPLLGELKVEGLTTKQIAELIAQKLKEGQYILEPKVNTLVKDYASQKIMVFGMINKPGIHYLRGKTTVLDLITELGGVQPGAGSLLIHRKSLASKTAEKEQGEENLITVDLQALLAHGDLSQDIQVFAGDFIYVDSPTKFTIYILGEVKKPGPYPFSKGITILRAVDMAGGFTDYASQNKIKVIREEEGKKKNIFVHMGDIQKGKTEKDIELEKGDVVVVPQSWF
jgi:polysaccharide export outer membrane protein